MIELQAVRKNKIHLADYDYQDDIKIRLLLASFTDTDVEILEEIFYNPVEFPLEQLLQNLSLTLTEALPSLVKLEEAGLLERDDHLIIVNKDQRKYFELQLEKFDEDFEPGMEFLQNLLKRVPIHVLPNWYHIPRHSNNIFGSLIEKYLITPQVFQRYLVDLNWGADPLGHIMNDVFQSPDLEISAEEIKRKYHLTGEAFEEAILMLEFHFVCCLGYRKEGHGWKEVVTPFQEWKEYLNFLQSSLPEEHNPQGVIQFRPDEYGFAKDIAELLMYIDREPTHFSYKGNKWHLDPKIAPFLITNFPQDHECSHLLSFSAYIDRLLEKVILLGFVDKRSSQLILTESAFEWLEMGSKEKALTIFKHPFHQIKTGEIHSDRNLHEIQNSLSRIARLGWVAFDDFIQGTAIGLKEEKKVRLKKEGRKWHYSIPVYSEDEKQYIETIVLEYLFESGIVRLGVIGHEIAFKLTDLGRSLFENNN